MDKLINIIEENIEKSINDYISLISNKYNIDIDELRDIWKSPTPSVPSVPTVPLVPSVPTVPLVPSVLLEPSVQKSKPKKSSSPSSKIKCAYKFTKGKQQGEMCSSIAKDNSQYCSKHMKFEDSGQKELKYNPLPAPVEKSVDRLVRLNKEINKWWHAESKLVFKSNKEKIVIGIYKNEIYSDLCEDDIEECNKYGFKYEIKSEPEPKKIEPSIKKAELKKIEKKSIGAITHQINTDAKNVEDVISDMLENTTLDSDNESGEEIEDELELELDEEY
jgi:hypothetical protein